MALPDDLASERKELGRAPKGDASDVVASVITVFQRPVYAVQDITNDDVIGRGWYVNLDTPRGRKAAEMVAQSLYRALEATAKCDD